MIDEAINPGLSIPVAATLSDFYANVNPDAPIHISVVEQDIINIVHGWMRVFFKNGDRVKYLEGARQEMPWAKYLSDLYRGADYLALDARFFDDFGVMLQARVKEEKWDVLFDFLKGTKL